MRVKKRLLLAGMLWTFSGSGWAMQATPSGSQTSRATTEGLVEIKVDRPGTIPTDNDAKVDSKAEEHLPPEETVIHQNTFPERESTDHKRAELTAVQARERLLHSSSPSNVSDVIDIRTVPLTPKDPAVSIETSIIEFKEDVLSRGSVLAGLQTQKAGTSLVSESRFKLTPYQVKKYSSKKVWCNKFDRDDLIKLKTNYHKLKVPTFLAQFLNLDLNFKDTKIYKAYPDTVNRTKDGTFVVQLNTPFLSKEHLEKLSDLTKLKNVEGGLALVGYYFHPKILFHSPLYNEYSILKYPIRAHDVSRSSYEEIEDLSTPYLVSILDLEQHHVSYLMEIKSLIETKLRNTFGVTSEDETNLYFHFPYVSDTASLHLHARVNQASPRLDNAKSFQLDDVIQVLESGRSILDMIVKRLISTDGCIYTTATFKAESGCSFQEDIEKPACYLPSGVKESFKGIQEIRTILTDNPFN